jgi:hypothetical protein
MDAPGAIDRFAWPRVESPPLASLLRTLAVSGLALLALAALLLCLRRANGALIQPLPAPILAACGALLALAALTFRGIVASSIVKGERRAAYPLWAIPSGVLLMWGGSLSLDGSAASGLAALWGLLLAEEGWSWGRLWRATSAATLLAPEPTAVACWEAVVADALAIGGLSKHSVAGVFDPGFVERVPASQRPATESHQPVSEVGAELDATVTQQMVRRRESDQSESLEGWLRADLATGQRHATAHIAICPPLVRSPECFAEQMDGPPATIKVGQVLPFGVRFEIKLDQPAREAASVLVEFSIQELPRESQRAGEQTFNCRERKAH